MRFVLVASNVVRRLQEIDRETDLPFSSQVHTVDQALTFTSGVGKATIAGKDQDVKAGDLMVVPAGTQHQFVNTGPTPLVRFRLSYSFIHSPPLLFLRSTWKITDRLKV